jgi:hypothetical protein
VHISVQAVPATVSTWPSASAITFGQAQSSSILSGGSASVSGAFAWSTIDSASSTFPAAGTPTYSVTFTPTNTNLYGALTTTSGQFVSVTVNKATPTGIAWPSATSIPIAGAVLSTSTLTPNTGTAAGIDSTTIDGNFTWAVPGTLSAAGTSTYSAIFTPDDSSDYNSVNGSVILSANTCGMQDDANLANLVNSTALYVSSDAQPQGTNTLTGNVFPLDVEGINESAICAVNSGSGDADANVTVTQPFITSGSASTSQTDSGSFGTNSAVLAYGTDTIAGHGAIITINDDGNGDPGSISTSANYTNAVFASYGGTVIINDAILSTSGNFSHGLAATNGGTLTVSNVQATNTGNNSAVISAGIGNGNNVSVAGGTYTSSGTHSAGIRAAGNGSLVNVTDGNGSGSSISVASGPIVVVEGENTVSINSIGNATWLSGSLGDDHGIFLYQGILGEATAGTSNFTMVGGSISYACDQSSGSGNGCTAGSPSGDQNTLATLFSVANTTAIITLTDVQLTNDTITNTNVNGTLLTVAALSHSGGTATFNANGESLVGDIIVDATSTVTLNLGSDGSSVGSSLTGAINSANSVGTVSLTLDSNSSWVAPNGPSYLTTLTGPGTQNVSCSNLGECSVYVAGVLQTSIQ